jgi:hypothetical protein
VTLVIGGRKGGSADELEEESGASWGEFESAEIVGGWLLKGEGGC